MRKLLYLLPLLIATNFAIAQKVRKIALDTLATKDSVQMQELKENLLDNIPIISLDENDLGDGSSQNVSTGGAGRDPFYNTASYNFSTTRFRIRGYNGENFATYMNGMPVESLDNGFTPFGLWGGLTSVMRNKELTVGLNHNNFGFGDIGATTNIDSRASKQRRTTQFTYGNSNRTYTHLWSFSHSTGLNKNGWAFTVSGSRRWSDEGYVPGTYYNGWSYFFGVDKRISSKTLISLVVFGAPTEYGKSGAAVKEIQEVMGTHYYNPYWGYQNGKKRNANVGKTNEPYIILTHDHKFNAHTSILTSGGFSFGERSASGLDWYNAKDPRPDYYRYLPAYAGNGDSLNTVAIADAFVHNTAVSQINWDGLFNANRSNNESFGTEQGHRARYFLQESVTNSRRINFNSVFNTRLSKHVDLTAGVSYQYQNNNYFKRITDLLGATYHVDLNQFAARSFPQDDSVIQNDLNRPNRIVKVGDRYGYDYTIHIAKSSAWTQAVFRFKQLSFFVAGEFSNTQFWRVGNVRNGLFPTNSYGQSDVYNFNNFGVKGGVSYKLDARNTFYLNGTYQTKAPLFDNAFNSPRTRNTVQDNLTSEIVQSVEGGYVLVAPKVKLRLTGYYTQFDKGLNVLTFYHDDYQNFVNYSLSNIGKLHFGGELGFEAKVIPRVTVDGAVSVGRYYYNTRQIAVTTLDNDASVKSFDTVYNNNYRVGGTPQEAYTLGISYRSRKYWFVTLSANYFDHIWIDVNPLRHTYSAVEGLKKDDPIQQAQRDAILKQEEFTAKFTMDFFGGFSWKLPREFGIKNPSFLGFNLGVNNLLNNKDIITGGLEQLRFDFKDQNATKFPNKYFYAYGTTYYASLTYRF